MSESAMNLQEIYDLVACFDHSTADAMKLTSGGFSLEMSRGGHSGTPAAVPTPAAPIAAEQPHQIKAPLVGTFYAAMAPDQPPLAAVGDRIKKGQTVCLLEAMKMMSEVTAPCECIIEEICVTNGQLVAFGQPLMRYRPC